MCLVCTMRTDLQKPPIRDEPILPFLMHLPFWQFLFQPIMLSILLKDYLCNSDILHIIYVTGPAKTGHISAQITNIWKMVLFWSLFIVNMFCKYYLLYN